MPPSPELGGGGREVGVAEVLDELDTQHSSNTPRDVGVAREVGEDLHREPERRGGDQRAVDALRAIREVDVGGDPVGAHELLEGSPQREPEPAPEGLGGQAPIALDLRQQVPGAHDRPSDEVRKHRDERGVVEEAPPRLEGSPPDVDRVGQRLERVERDPDGERDLQQGQGDRPAERVERALDVRRKEVEVFERPEQAEVAGEARPQKPRSWRTGICACRGPCRSPGWPRTSGGPRTTDGPSHKTTSSRSTRRRFARPAVATARSARTPRQTAAGKPG